MEPMCSAFQEDVKCYEEGVDFMLGDSLLVANVVEKGAVSRKVYLPEGETFYDFYTRAAYEGGRTVELPVDLGSIPLFVRSGAIIPMAEDRLDNLKTQQAEHIRDDSQQDRYITLLTLTQFLTGKPIDLPEQENGDGGRQYGEAVNDSQHNSLIKYRHDTEIRKQE